MELLSVKVKTVKNDVQRPIKSEDTDARAYDQTTNRKQPRIKIFGGAS